MSKNGARKKGQDLYTYLRTGKTADEFFPMVSQFYEDHQEADDFGSIPCPQNISKKS